MASWNGARSAWSIGSKGSGARIEIDEPLGDCQVGIVRASNHALLWGTAKELPEVWMLRDLDSDRPLVPFEPERWWRIERSQLAESTVGDVRLRFDRRPIRFGHHLFEVLNNLFGAP
jgi:hypothetical protein